MGCPVHPLLLAALLRIGWGDLSRLGSRRKEFGEAEGPRGPSKRARASQRGRRSDQLSTINPQLTPLPGLVTHTCRADLSRQSEAAAEVRRGGFSQSEHPRLSEGRGIKGEGFSAPSAFHTEKCAGEGGTHHLSLCGRRHTENRSADSSSPVHFIRL